MDKYTDLIERLRKYPCTSELARLTDCAAEAIAELVAERDAAVAELARCAFVMEMERWNWNSDASTDMKRTAVRRARFFADVVRK